MRLTVSQDSLHTAVRMQAHNKNPSSPRAPAGRGCTSRQQSLLAGNTYHQTPIAFGQMPILRLQSQKGKPTSLFKADSLSNGVGCSHETRAPPVRFRGVGWWCRHPSCKNLLLKQHRGRKGKRERNSLLYQYHFSSCQLMNFLLGFLFGCLPRTVGGKKQNKTKKQASQSLVNP